MSTVGPKMTNKTNSGFERPATCWTDLRGIYIYRVWRWWACSPGRSSRFFLAQFSSPHVTDSPSGWDCPRLDGLQQPCPMCWCQCQRTSEKLWECPWSASSVHQLNVCHLWVHQRAAVLEYARQACVQHDQPNGPVLSSGACVLMTDWLWRELQCRAPCLATWSSVCDGDKSVKVVQLSSNRQKLRA